MPVVCLHSHSLFWESLRPGHTQVYLCLSPHTPRVQWKGQFCHLLRKQVKFSTVHWREKQSEGGVHAVRLHLLHPDCGGTWSELQFLRTGLPGTETTPVDLFLKWSLACCWEICEAVTECQSEAGFFHASAHRGTLSVEGRKIQISVTRGSSTSSVKCKMWKEGLERWLRT